MATSKLSGVNFAVEGTSVEFFDAIGAKLDRGSWGINALGGGLLVEVEPDSMVEAIHDCINGDVENGNGDKVAMILFAPRSAVIFYLEGRLTRAHLASAIEGPDFIEISNVEFDGRILTVRILGKPEYNVATADSEGNVL